MDVEQKRMSGQPWSWVIRILFVWSVFLPSQGCVESRNRAPVLDQLPDLVFESGRLNQFELSAIDPDGDPLNFDYRLSPSPPSFMDGGGRRPELQRVTQGVIFRWAPTSEDAAGVSQGRYVLTLTAADGNGGEASISVSLLVEPTDNVSPGTIYFSAPSSDGVFSQTDCVEDLVATVVGGLPNSPPDVRIASVGELDCEVFPEQCPRLTDRTSSSDEYSVEVTWCPPEDVLAQFEHFLMRFEAKIVGADAWAERDFFVRFDAPEAPSCSAVPPTIEHSREDVVRVSSGFLLQAAIEDDMGFEVPPVALYGYGDRTDIQNLNQWQASTFTRGPDDLWEAVIPIEFDGARTLVYQILATDNDDADGTGCDRSRRSEWFEIDPQAGNIPTPQGGVCDPCVADLECAQEGAICVDLLGAGFCLPACMEDEDCSLGTSCRNVVSLDGREGRQCIPSNLDCGQLCFDDSTEGDSGNEQRNTATLIDEGRLDDLSICLGDQDWFRFVVEQGSSLSVEMNAGDGGEELNFAVFLPDNPGIALEAIPTGQGGREIVLDCMTESGEGLLKVWGPGGAEARYALNLYTGVGRCGMICEPDLFEVDDPQENRQVRVELPFEQRLTICPNDQDYFVFPVERATAYSVSLEPADLDAPLAYILYRGEIALEERPATPGRSFEFIAESDGEYGIRVFSENPNFSGQYRLVIQRSEVGRCSDAQPCPAGTRCENNVCVGRPCHGADQCRPGEECVVDRYALHLEAGVGACYQTCESDRDCGGQQQRCKQLARGRGACLPSGNQEIGGGCTDYSECAGPSLCLDEPGGYCSVVGCQPGLCGRGAMCVNREDGGTVCRKTCRLARECRSELGYTCVREMGALLGHCAPR